MHWRRLFKPRSTLTLTLLGFSVVTLPLLAALGLTAVYVDRIAEQSETSVNSAALAMQGSTRLNQALTGMERNARQYLILGESAILASYEDNRNAFQINIQRLTRLMQGTEVTNAITAINTRETALYQKLSSPEARDELDQQAVADSFDRLRELAQEIQTGSRRLVDAEVAAIQRAASNTKEWLFWLGAALIPLTVLSSAVFTALIARPIKGLDQAMRQLGANDFEHAIQINGPEDLRALGARLEWLRLRLKELENEKARFLRHVSHELKTPLTAIRESGDLLQSEAAGQLNEEQREITGILTESGRRLQGLIENLLDFAQTQSQSQRHALSVSELDMPKLVREVLREHHSEVRAKKLQLATRLRPCHIHGDEAKLKTVVDNLVSNAIKFSPERGRLTVTVTRRRDWTTLTVADTGPGIPENDRERIFESFVQGSVGSGSEVKGTGLGLSIVREYVRAHGGYVTIADNTGPGSQLRVELPRTPQQPGRGNNASNQ